MDLVKEQRAVCTRFGVDWYESPPHLKLGVTKDVRTDLQPINGLRHPPQGDTTGWYIWSGEMPCPDDLGLWVPLHVSHLSEWCPRVLPYLGLPPGWRFLLAEGYEDVWEDKSLLKV
jgi:hypothetical protein